MDNTERRSEMLGKSRNVLLEVIEKIIWTDRARNEVLLRVKKEITTYIQQNEGRITGLVIHFVGTVFYRTVLKQR